MRILITGVSGFAGSHLAEYAITRGDTVAGTVRWRSSREFIPEHVKLFECDLRDDTAIRDIIRAYRPQKVFHLAAQSFVGSSFAAPADTYETNVMGQLHLLQALREYVSDARVLVCGSSEEYGLVSPEEAPINEGQPLRPLSPYGVSKVTQDMMGYQFHKSYGLHVVRTRAFNHEGPRRGSVFAPSAFAKQVVECEAGQRHFIDVGNLEALRDFTDVRDMVKAYYAAIDLAPDVYNIGSGEPWRIGAVLDHLVAQSVAEFSVRQDIALMRPSDVPLLVADATKFTDLTGWKPEIPFTQTLEDLLDFWRRRIPAPDRTPLGI